MQSDVVITGYRLNAKEPAQKALERILGLAPEVARALARTFPAVVLEGAANDNALRIRDQLESAGALVELRASQPRLERAPLDLPATRGGAFDLDLDLPMAKGGSPPKANKGGGTGAFALPPKTGGFPAPKTHPGAFAAPGMGTGPLAVPPPPGKPRAPQPTSRNLRGSMPQPPPPPPAAYQLGDFGMAPRGQSVVAKLPTGPSSTPSLAPSLPSLSPARTPAVVSPPTLADGDFDFESAMGGGLELDLGTGPRQSLPRKPSTPQRPSMPREEVHAERFGALAGARAAGKAPDVDAQAFKSLQRRPDSRRPAKKQDSLVVRVLRGALPGVMLVSICALTLGAVGYALDPADPIGGLARAKALPLTEPGDETAHQEGYLHPLLRSTPRPMRAPVAAVLRARITGVHDVPVSFPTRHGQVAQCALVEHGPDTEARLKGVRETGHEVATTPSAAAQLIEHERALRAELQRLDLQFTRVCLVP
ncbi:MAG: hypothetical protein ABW352_18745 [Polyangiales bacterium]